MNKCDCGHDSNRHLPDNMCSECDCYNFTNNEERRIRDAEPAYEKI